MPRRRRRHAESHAKPRLLLELELTEEARVYQSGALSRLPLCCLLYFGRKGEEAREAGNEQWKIFGESLYEGRTGGTIRQREKSTRRVKAKRRDNAPCPKHGRNLSEAERKARSKLKFQPTAPIFVPPMPPFGSTLKKAGEGAPLEQGDLLHLTAAKRGCRQEMRGGPWGALHLLGRQGPRFAVICK
jgi:hypothetical protein